MNNSIQQHSQASCLRGSSPWLPGPFRRWQWFNQPIAAELLALLRIGVAAVLVLDLLVTIWPELHLLYGNGSTGDPRLYGWMFQRPQLHWSLFEEVGDHAAIRLAFVTWLAAAIGLLLGWNTRLCAAVAWTLTISFTHLNIYGINAGDHIRCMLLLYLMLTPCGACWSIDAWLPRLRQRQPQERLLVHPWALRLLLIQLAWMYFASGLCKLSGQSWTSGESLYYVLNDVSITRFSAAQVQLPLCLLKLMTWSVLIWEVAFPALLLTRWTRLPALLFGMGMHVGIFVTMELGCFPLYLIAAYVPLIADQLLTTNRSANSRSIMQPHTF